MFAELADIYFSCVCVCVCVCVCGGGGGGGGGGGLAALCLMVRTQHLGQHWLFFKGPYK